LFSWGPSLDHYGATFVAAWVANLSVGLGLIPGFTTFMSHIGVNEWGFENAAQKDVFDAQSP
jgi:hypothetical protein